MPILEQVTGLFIGPLSLKLLPKILSSAIRRLSVTVLASLYVVTEVVLQFTSFKGI